MYLYAGDDCPPQPEPPAEPIYCGASIRTAAVDVSAVTVPPPYVVVDVWGIVTAQRLGDGLGPRGEVMSRARPTGAFVAAVAAALLAVGSVVPAVAVADVGAERRGRRRRRHPVPAGGHRLGAGRPSTWCATAAG